MKFSDFSQYLEKLEKTSGRIEMTKILAELFNKCAIEEVDKICYLLLGRLVPLFESLEFNIAEKTMTRVLSSSFQANEQQVRNLFKEVGDLGEAAYELKVKRKKEKGKKEMSISEVFEKLSEIAKDSGIGSQERKVQLFSKLLKQVDPLSAKYLVRITLGKMRLGMADKTLIEALSWMQKGDKTLKEEIEKYYFVYPDIGVIANKFKKGGIKTLQKIELSIGVPILPELCQRIGTAKEIIEKMGSPADSDFDGELSRTAGKVAVEPKFDGTRVQLHFSRKKKGQELDKVEFDFGEIQGKGFVKTFTRNLENTTHMFPEIIESTFYQIDAKEVILDGEAVAFNPKTKKLLPFQITIQRKRKYGIKDKIAEIPLKYFIFDILFKDGKNLLNEPFSGRRKILQKILRKSGTIVLTPQDIVSSASELTKLFNKAIKQGLEGVVVKKIDGVYEPGARDFSWVKFKREEESEFARGIGGLADTIDCVVLGYNTGKGKRVGFGIGAFLVGVYNKNKDSFDSISKIGTGLTDEQWREMKRRCDKIRMAKKPTRFRVHKNMFPDFWVKPGMVVEILADEITRSPIHTAGMEKKESGYALRFPRLICWRDDKSAQQATTVAEIKRLYKLQRQK